MVIATDDNTYAAISSHAMGFRVVLSSEEMAEISVRNDFGEAELKAVEKVFAYLAKKHYDKTIETLLRLSRLPQKAPKTFGNFDFARIQGQDAAVLEKLSSLANLYARKNIAFIGPGGIGKTHLAQAYGRACCLSGYKTYYLKATELKEKFERAITVGNPAKVVNSLVKPSCLIIDEVGRCMFSKPCTDMFFDVIDRRYEKEGPNVLILTSNTPPVNWDEFFTGDETLMCMLDRIFDRASVFMMKGASFRGLECEIFTVESLPQALKLTK